MALCLPFSYQSDRPFILLKSDFLPGLNSIAFHNNINRRNRTKSKLLYNVPISISCSAVKVVRDRKLDRHVVQRNKIRFVQKLKTLLLSKPKHYIPIHILAKCRSYLSLPKPRSILRMIYRYPSIFELFTIPFAPTPLNATKEYPQLCVRLTPAAAALASEELNLKSVISITLASKLQKLLMLSSHHRLLLSKLVHIAPDLGLPPNFRSRLCNDHPEKFKTVDTSYGRALELVFWDPQLAKPLPSQKVDSLGLIVDRPLKFKQLRLRRGLNIKRRHEEFLIKFEDLPEACPYETPSAVLDKESLEAEKRSCAVVREVLGMAIEKRTLIDHLTHFRKEFGLPNKLRAMILRHPELFYVSLKGQRDSVFLVEGFNEKGDLLEKDETLVVQDRWIKLARESKRMRLERRKARIYGHIGGGEYNNSDDEDGDTDADDGYELDNFSDGYNDGFENMFEDTNLETGALYDDQMIDVSGQNEIREEFWVADTASVQNGFDTGKMQPW